MISVEWWLSLFGSWYERSERGGGQCGVVGTRGGVRDGLSVKIVVVKINGVRMKVPGNRIRTTKRNHRVTYRVRTQGKRN